MPVELRHLRYFAAVADAGQVSRAASGLYVTQPALSQALRQLERELGVALLRRHPRGVTLTTAGEAFLVHARDALRAVDDASEAARRSEREPPPRLTVGFLPFALGRYPLAILDLFACVHPEVRLRLRELTYITHTSALTDGDVDVAFLWPPYGERRLALLKLAEEPRVLGVASRHPLADAAALPLEDVLDELFPGYHPASSGDWFTGWFFEPQRGGPAQLTDDAVATPSEMAAVVLMGGAVAPAAASFAAAFSLPGVRWISLTGAPPATLALAWRLGNRSPVVQAFRRTAELAGLLAA